MGGFLCAAPVCETGAAFDAYFSATYEDFHGIYGWDSAKIKVYANLFGTLEKFCFLCNFTVYFG